MMEVIPPDRQPGLIAMKGMPGSGKSTLARRIGKRIGWKVIDKDETKDALHGENSDAGRRAYQVTLEEVERELRNGTSVIYDSPLTFASLYEEICGIAGRTGANVLLVECRCSDDAELRKRIEERVGKGLEPHRITDWSEFLAYRERTSPLCNYPVDHPRFVAETTLPLSELTDSILQWLPEGRENSEG